MNVTCPACGAGFNDEFRSWCCPHSTFAANDGRNNFAHHHESPLVTTRLVPATEADKTIMQVEMDSHGCDRSPLLHVDRSDVLYGRLARPEYAETFHRTWYGWRVDWRTRYASGSRRWFDPFHVWGSE